MALSPLPVHPDLGPSETEAAGPVRPRGRGDPELGSRRADPPPSRETVVAASNLYRRFGSKVALDDASFTVRAGTVTGFLGPNGAGKTTALRIVLGLDRANGGEVLVFGRPFRQLEAPARLVGALLDGSGFHPGRTARSHLLVQAELIDVPRARVDHLLDAVGLVDDADRRVGGFSLGMRRRLGLATAMLGEPQLLVLDEPSNGLDPAGMVWLRRTLRAFAADGGTVLISSHVLAEVAEAADDVVVLDRGRVVAQLPVSEIAGDGLVVVRSGDVDRLQALVTEAGATARRSGQDGLDVDGLTAADLGRIAAANAIPLTHLSTRRHTLEEAFFSLIEGGSNDAEG